MAERAQAIRFPLGRDAHQERQTRKAGDPLLDRQPGRDGKRVQVEGGSEPVAFQQHRQRPDQARHAHVLSRRHPAVGRTLGQ